MTNHERVPKSRSPGSYFLIFPDSQACQITYCKLFATYYVDKTPATAEHNLPSQLVPEEMQQKACDLCVMICYKKYYTNQAERFSIKIVDFKHCVLT